MSGQGLLDAVDLCDLDEPTLRSAIVMVTQENYLFGGSVENKGGRLSAGQRQHVAFARLPGRSRRADPRRGDRVARLIRPGAVPHAASVSAASLRRTRVCSIPRRLRVSAPLRERISTAHGLYRE